jgi:hypothetical protein
VLQPASVLVSDRQQRERATHAAASRCRLLLRHPLWHGVFLVRAGEARAGQAHIFRRSFKPQTIATAILVNPSPSTPAASCHQPVYTPFALPLLERALAAPGVGFVGSVAPGGAGLTAVLHADREPFASWAAHLASFGCQVRAGGCQARRVGQSAVAEWQGWRQEGRQELPPPGSPDNIPHCDPELARAQQAAMWAI